MQQGHPVPYDECCRILGQAILESQYRFTQFVQQSGEQLQKLRNDLAQEQTRVQELTAKVRELTANGPRQS